MAECRVQPVHIKLDSNNEKETTNSSSDDTPNDEPLDENDKRAEKMKQNKCVFRLGERVKFRCIVRLFSL